MSIEFKRAGDGTDLLLKHEQLFDEKARDEHQRGWTASLEKLDWFLQSNA